MQELKEARLTLQFTGESFCTFLGRSHPLLSRIDFSLEGLLLSLQFFDLGLENFHSFSMLLLNSLLVPLLLRMFCHDLLDMGGQLIVDTLSLI